MLRHISTDMAATGTAAKWSHAGPVYLNFGRWHDAKVVLAKRVIFTKKISTATIR
jgi:hypothetical protein